MFSGIVLGFPAREFNFFQTRSQDFAWGVFMSASGTKSRAPLARERRGVWGYRPPGNFEKWLSQTAFRAF